MWIKLHLQNGNQITYIQTQHITHLSKTGGGGNPVLFLDDGTTVIVSETLDNLIYMIKGDYLSGV